MKQFQTNSIETSACQENFGSELPNVLLKKICWI